MGFSSFSSMLHPSASPFRGFSDSGNPGGDFWKATVICFFTFLILLSAGTADARFFNLSFQNLTTDMPFPNGQKAYRLGNVNNGNGTMVFERLTLTDLQLLASLDGMNASVTSFDSDCNTAEVLLFTATAQCHSYAESHLMLNFTAYRNSVSPTYPVRINAYVYLEAYGNQTGNADCGATEYASFFVRVYNWSSGAWANFYASTGTGLRSYAGWINITINSPSYVNSTTGEVRYNISAYAYQCNGQSNTQQSMCGSMAWAYVYVDYIEVFQEVPDSYTTPVGVSYVTDSLPPTWSDVVYNETVSLTARATDSSGNGVASFPILLYAVDESGNEQLVGIGITNSTGYATSFRIISGEGYRMNFSRIAAWDGWIINNYAYVRNSTTGSQTITPPETKGRNIAIVPATYVLNLIGRMYYPGGVDWARFVWYVHDTSIQRYRGIPISQKFVNNTVSFSVWKYGLDYNCTDNSTPCDREGIFGNAQRPYWNPACIVIGQRSTTMTPLCDRTPVGYTPLRARVSVHLLSITITANVGGVVEFPNCYVDTDPYGRQVGAHRCGLFSGYRVGPLIQMNIPDNALGFSGWIAVDSYGGTLGKLMASTTYRQHEGPGNLSLTEHNLNICGMSSIQNACQVGHTEYAFSYETQTPITVPDVFLGADATGYAWLQPDRRGGLGTIGFLALYGDRNHVVGMIMGHRFGVHPFVALVQTVPEYPSTQAGWNGYEHRWLYYLFENLRFIAETQGKELSIWNYRYPNATAQANLVRSFEDLIVDFTPYLNSTLSLLVQAPTTLVYPFVVSTVLNLGDFGYLMKITYSNQTIFNKGMDAALALMTNLGNILGPPPPNCHLSNPNWNDPSSYPCYGLNFIWAGSDLLSYSERELFAYRLVELFNTLVSLAIELMKAFPELNNTSAPWTYPKWNYNWIYPE